MVRHRQHPDLVRPNGVDEGLRESGDVPLADTILDQGRSFREPADLAQRILNRVKKYIPEMRTPEIILTCGFIDFRFGRLMDHHRAAYFRHARARSRTASAG